MCTLTVFPLPEGGYRLAFNRDESRRRPVALPPVVSRCGGRSVVWPIDRQGGGTWIGVNDAGLSAALLNVYPGPASPGAPRDPAHASRGEIVPILLAAGTLAEAAATAAALDARRYPPFRVVVCHDGFARDVRSDGLHVTVGEPIALDVPMLRTSSGLGDGRVEGPRGILFASLLELSDPTGAQDAFHRHAWRSHPDLSVCMRRPEAATVSLSLLDVDRRSGQAAFIYHPAAPDEDVLRHVVLLDLPGGRRARAVA